LPSPYLRLDVPFVFGRKISPRFLARNQKLFIPHCPISFRVGNSSSIGRRSTVSSRLQNFQFPPRREWFFNRYPKPEKTKVI
jgi:hypothetical protein